MPQTRRARVEPRAAPAAGRAAVLGLGMHVPARVLTNADLARMVNTSDAWIVARTGIRTRRIVEGGQASSDLAVPAARAALADAGIAPGELDLIICATTTPDMLFRAPACLVGDRLGARRAGAFDLLAACSSFVYGVISAAQAIEAGLARYVLVVGAEALTRLVDWTDRTTCVLIGDGADGSAGDILKLPAPGSRIPATPEMIAQGQHRARMDGQAVFRLAVRIVPEAIARVAAAGGLRLDDIDWIVPHEANQRIIEAVARASTLPLERFVSTIEHYGNTSSASIPISLYEARQDGRLRPGHRVVLVAFGGGFTWSACALTWGA